MTQTALSFDVSQLVRDTFINVFDAMLSLKATACSETLPLGPGPRVTGSIGLAGENLTGAVYLHFFEPFARQATAAMFGLNEAELSQSEVNDAIGELCNIVAGGLKSSLCDASFPCAVSTPAIIRGTAFQVETPMEGQRTDLSFDCQGQRVAVEVHLNFN